MAFDWLSVHPSKQLFSDAAFVALMTVLGVASTGFSIFAALVNFRRARGRHHAAESKQSGEVHYNPVHAQEEKSSNRLVEDVTVPNTRLWAYGFVAYALMPLLATPGDTLSQLPGFDSFHGGQCSDGILARVCNAWSGLFSTLTLVYFAQAARGLACVSFEASSSKEQKETLSQSLLSDQESKEAVRKLSKRLNFQHLALSVSLAAVYGFVYFLPVVVPKDYVCKPSNWIMYASFIGWAVVVLAYCVTFLRANSKLVSLSMLYLTLATLCLMIAVRGWKRLWGAGCTDATSSCNILTFSVSVGHSSGLHHGG
eukprot:scaffold693_cov399-Prasinococcus_capsulatus_cf.AAC.5